MQMGQVHDEKGAQESVRQVHNKKSRSQAWRDKAQANGLKRIEVLVPVDKVHQLKAYVADLRHGDKVDKLHEVRNLINKAYSQYYARYLDNISIDPDSADFADAAIIAAALMNRGNGKAYQLGQKLRKLAR